MEKVKSFGHVRDQRAHRVVYSQGDDAMALQLLHYYISALAETGHHPLLG
jgi:hypothetical protein